MTGMTERLTVGRAHEGGCLTLHHGDCDPWIRTFVAVAEDRGLTAELTVVTSTGDGLAEFLSGLADDYRGWSGVRSWESMGHELVVSAVFRSRGHVAITWRLVRRRYAQEDWAAEVTTVIEAGEEMRQLAADITAFIRCDDA